MTLCGGRRCCAAFAASAALIAGLVLKLSSLPPDIAIDVLSPSRPPVPVRRLTPEEVSSYRRDGAAFAPGLISPESAAALASDAEGEVERRAPWTLLDLFKSLYSRVVFDAWRVSEVYASLALTSLPAVAAQLLLPSDDELNGGGGNGDGRSDDEGEGEIRLLRDAYFSYSPGGKGCGWHVDDEGFWPTHPSSTGLTVWIALDAMAASEGGGLAVVNSTAMLTAKGREWAEGCKPEKGTCNMEEERPECHREMERFELRWDVRPGDAILWDRRTYHRGVPAAEDDGGGGESDGRKRRRYSVRYMPADSRALGMVHASVAQGSRFDSPYYPQVWPRLVDSEIEALRTGLEGDATLLNVFRSIVPVARQMMATSKETKG